MTAGSFSAALPPYGSQAIKFTPKTRVVCDDVPTFHSAPVRKSPHYLRTYVQLDCAVGESIVEVRYASLGLPHGECGDSQRETNGAGVCHTDGSEEVERACLGRRSCRVETAGLAEPGGTTCGDNTRLAVEAVCA